MKLTILFAPAAVAVLHAITLPGATATPVDLTPRAAPAAPAAPAATTVCHTWSVTTSDGRTARCVTKNTQNTACPALGTAPFAVSIQANDDAGASCQVSIAKPVTGANGGNAAGNGQQQQQQQGGAAGMQAVKVGSGGPVKASFADGSGSATATLVSNGSSGC